MKRRGNPKPSAMISDIIFNITIPQFYTQHLKHTTVSLFPSCSLTVSQRTKTKHFQTRSLSPTKVVSDEVPLMPCLLPRSTVRSTFHVQWVHIFPQPRVSAETCCFPSFQFIRVSIRIQPTALHIYLFDQNTAYSLTHLSI